jgi:arsenite/tail-anchored protein-transporting ATPase
MTEHLTCNGSSAPRRTTRVVLVTGKGGVGKTTLSAATAAVAAERGARTLLVSTDEAHSLEDVLLRRLGAEPEPVTGTLDGLQLDGRHELQRSWSSIVDYLRHLLGIAELEQLHVDELVVIPGLDQLVALARLRELVDSGAWDAIIVDCAPSADSLRLLALPDVIRWYVERLFGRNGRFNAWARRRIERTLAVPVPDESVLASISEMTDDLTGLRATLDAGGTTARIVTTPERVVLAEAQRTLSYLALYGYAVDAVFVNRVEAGVAADSRLGAVNAAFADLPRLTVHRRPVEPLGLGPLVALGDELYGGRDPLDRLAPGRALEFSSRDGESMVRIPATGVQRDRIELARDRDELIVTLGSHRRTVRLPDALRHREVVRAGLAATHLEVVFGEAGSVD